MAHDANNNVIRLYVNNSLRRTDADHGGASSRMECRFRNLRHWRR